MLVVLQLALSAISLLTALLVATDVVRIWQLLALAFVIALCDVSSFTASQSIVVDVVPRQQLFVANALFSAAANLATVAGPVLAGALIARFSIAYAFAFSALLLGGSALAATSLRAVRRGEGKPVTTVWQDLVCGLRHIGQTPTLLWLLLLGLTAMAVGVWFALAPRYARDILESGAAGYGSILSARGIGGLVGLVRLIAVGCVRRLGAVLVACAVAFAALALLFAFSRALPAAVAIAFGLGIVFIWWPATLRTAFQFASTEEMRGRTMSLFSLVGQILTLGWFVGGVLSEALGPQRTMIVAALLCAFVNLLTYLRSAELRAIGREDE